MRELCSFLLIKKLIAGLAITSDGRRKLVVTGGRTGNTPLQSTEILDLDTLQVTSGQDLPAIRYHAASVQYKNTFLVVGGMNGNDRVTDTIFEFDPENDTWIIRTERMALGRSAFAAFIVPPEHVNCF